MIQNWRKKAETAGLGVLGVDAFRRVLMRAAARNGRTLVLAYHRVNPRGPLPEDLPPTITVERFRQHLEILSEAGEILPFLELLDGTADHGLRFAITFDDDHADHVRHVLPVLTSFGVTATFFLSGRALHQLGQYWWESLEQAVRTHGLRAVAEALDVDAATVHDLGRQCEGTRLAEHVSELFPLEKGEARLDAAGIRTLAEAGMEIGFHTVRHPILTRVSEADVDDALTFGRAELAEAAGVPVVTFAYPHGQASHAVAQRVEAAGYRAAVTNMSYVIRPDSDQFLLGRWDPRTQDARAFRRSLALRLNRPAAGPQAPSH